MILIRPSKFFVQAFSRNYVCFRSFFRSFEETKMIFLFIVLNHSSPPIAIRMSIHSFVPRSIIFTKTFVLFILSMRCFSYFFPTVIARVQIFMINLFRRPFSCHVEPSKPMSHIHGTVNSYQYITIASFMSCYLSFFTSRSSINTPAKKTRGWVVANNLFYIFYRQFFVIYWQRHGEFPSLEGIA